MKNKSLGCLSANGLLSAAFTLVVLGGVYWARGGLMFNPGPLSAVSSGSPLAAVSSHAETEGRCSACHAPFWGQDTMTERCLDCHSQIELDLSNPESLHGALIVGNPDWHCRQCHTEHQGADGVLTNLDTDDFPHEITGFSLAAHQQNSDGGAFECQDCHRDAGLGFEPATCENCHLDVDRVYIEEHVASFGSGCQSCHDGVDTYGGSFDHTLTDFPLTGRHGELSCGNCHSGMETIAGLQGTPTDCYDCHADVDNHNGEFGTNCGVCHDPASWEQASFNHNLTGFILFGVHTTTECLACHINGRFEETPQECVGCHAGDDAHDGQLGRDCARCHIPDDWERLIFDHNQTGFPLAGSHLDIECAQCHTEASFQGIPTDCIGCHDEDDAHAGQLGQDCARCHTPTEWQQSIFDHAETGFLLTGSHDRIECTQCHADGQFEGIPQECAACHAEPVYHAGFFESNCENCHSTDAWSPAQFGLPHTFPTSHGRQGPSTCQTCHPSTLAGYTCYGCHEHDPGEIAEEHRDEGINDFQDCTRCHPTGQEEEGEGD